MFVHEWRLKCPRKKSWLWARCLSLFVKWRGSKASLWLLLFHLFLSPPGPLSDQDKWANTAKKRERSIRKAPFCLGNGLRYQKTISFNQNHFSLDLSLEQLDPFFLKTHFTFRYAHNLKIDGSRAGERWNCFNTKQWYFIFKLAK